MSVQPLALAALLVGTLAAFGGAYAWALPFIVAGAGGVCLLGGAATWRAPADHGALHSSFALLAAGVALQLVPLPAGLRALLSPHAGPVEGVLRSDALVREVPALTPLTLDPLATVQALALLAAVALTYRAALVVFSRGGIRQMTRILTVTGVVAALAAMVQLALSPSLIYGFWLPDTPGARPFGPMVNRNHMAAWLVMVSALASGYMVARLRTRLDGPVVGGSWQRLIRRVLDSGAPSLAAAWGLMALAVAVSRSRSGIIGLAVALAVLWRGGITRNSHPRLATVSVLLVSTALVAVALLTDVTAVADRFASSFAPGDTGRPVIWRETLPLIRDFWLTGTGAGTYGMAMAAYQHTLPVAPHLDSRIHFNHAHNHYLHVAAEGGLLLVVPVLLTVAAFLRLAMRRLRDERGELLWLRQGAFGGLIAVAALSIWEIPLSNPANALLAATLAAIVTCKRTGS